MISAIQSSLSALQAFGKKMGITANNVANVGSEGFKKSMAIFTEGSGGGVLVETRRVETPGQKIVVEESGKLVEKELSNVDLTEEIPQSLVVNRMYQANLKVLRAGDELAGILMDTMK